MDLIQIQVVVVQEVLVGVVVVEDVEAGEDVAAAVVDAVAPVGRR
ncbi:hypothetical protein [Pseudomonas poae]